MGRRMKPPVLSEKMRQQKAMEHIDELDKKEDLTLKEFGELMYFCGKELEIIEKRRSLIVEHLMNSIPKLEETLSLATDTLKKYVDEGIPHEWRNSNEIRTTASHV